MTPDESAAVDCIQLILRRKPDHVAVENEQCLLISVDELELDSVDRLDLVMELEQRFDVVFTTNAITGCKTVAEIIAVIGEERARTAGTGVA
jgi:acyl carrier protein